MRCDEYVDGIRPRGGMEIEMRELGRGEVVHAQRELRGDAGSKSRMMTGQYVPDEEHVQVCLNCKKKYCTGYCRLVSGGGKKRKERA